MVSSLEEEMTWLIDDDYAMGQGNEQRRAAAGAEERGRVSEEEKDDFVSSMDCSIN
jgi:hypothetical protein